MSSVWVVVAVVGAATVIFKSAGPVLLGGRDLPLRVRSVVALLAPQVRGRRPLVAATLGGGIALALVPLAPPGVPIVVASLACLVGWTRP